MGCATFEHDERRLGEDNSSAVRTASEVDQEQIKNARLSPAEHVTFLIDFSDLERITRFSLSGSDWHSSTDMAVQWFFGLTWDRGSITRYAWTVRLDGQTVNPEKPLVHGCARTRVVCVWGGEGGGHSVSRVPTLCVCMNKTVLDSQTGRTDRKS